MTKVLVALLATLPIVAFSWATGSEEKGKEEPKAPAHKPDLQNSVGMKFALVKAGKFLMGAPKDEEDSQRHERPQHEVELTEDFHMGIHEVTERQWRAVMGFPDHSSDRAAKNIKWFDAEAFVTELTKLDAEKKSGRTYRLPTEAEWEYACRGGHLIPKIGAAASLPFHFDKPTGKLSFKAANFDGTFPYGTNTRPGPEHKSHVRDVGSYPPNALGIHDMHGNLMEWCSDWFDGRIYLDDNRKNPKGPAHGTHRVLRGGSYIDKGENCRAAFRYANLPGLGGFDTGFRVICEVQKK